MIPLRPPVKTQVLRDEYAQRCQETDCPAVVPSKVEDFTGWIVLGDLTVYAAEWLPERPGPAWFCSWSHLASWADRNAIHKVTQP